MKRILIITVLAVLLCATVGATTAMAAVPPTTLTCQSSAGPHPVGSPFDITGTLTLAMTRSSHPFPNRVITVYASTDGTTWTPVGSASTDAGGLYVVTTSQNAEGLYYYKAVYGGDKAFPQTTSPTVTVWVGPVATSGGYQLIRGFWLENHGGFVAKIACYYSTDGGVTWHESDHTKGIVWTDVKTAELGDLGVPVGALVKIHVIVVAGKDRTGDEVFQYDPNAYPLPGKAYYIIGGTTLNSWLIDMGILT